MAPGDVAAQHEDHAEFADGMRKLSNHGGHKRAPGQRDEQTEDQLDRPGTEQLRGVDESGGYRCESSHDGLHGKGQAVDYRPDDHPEKEKARGWPSNAVRPRPTAV